MKRASSQTLCNWWLYSGPMSAPLIRSRLWRFINLFTYLLTYLLTNAVSCCLAVWEGQHFPIPLPVMSAAAANTCVCERIRLGSMAPWPWHHPRVTWLPPTHRMSAVRRATQLSSTGWLGCNQRPSVWAPCRRLGYVPSLITDAVQVGCHDGRLLGRLVASLSVVCVCVVLFSARSARSISILILHGLHVHGC